MEAIVRKIQQRVSKGTGIRMSLETARKLALLNGFISGAPSHKLATESDIVQGQVVMGILYPRKSHVCEKMSDVPSES